MHQGQIALASICEHIPTHLPSIHESLDTFAQPKALLNTMDSLPFKMREALQTAGVPRVCVVYEGVYGVGFAVVQALCGVGVERVVVLSAFALTKRALCRFEQLKW